MLVKIVLLIVFFAVMVGVGVYSRTVSYTHLRAHETD